jgi:hypothetical protein
LTSGVMTLTGSRDVHAKFDLEEVNGRAWIGLLAVSSAACMSLVPLHPSP